MADPKLNRYYRVLELEPDASFKQIKAAYLHFKNLYSSNSPIFHCLGMDISESRRHETLASIHQAYFELREHFLTQKKDKQTTTQATIKDNRVPEFETFSGDALRLTREVLGISLEEVSFSCGIPVRHLISIEREEYENLPPRGYLRIYVKNYALFMCLDAFKVVTDYMSRMEKVLR